MGEAVSELREPVVFQDGPEPLSCNNRLVRSLNSARWLARARLPDGATQIAILWRGLFIAVRSRLELAELVPQLTHL